MMMLETWRIEAAGPAGSSCGDGQLLRRAGLTALTRSSYQSRLDGVSEQARAPA